MENEILIKLNKNLLGEITSFLNFKEIIELFSKFQNKKFFLSLKNHLNSNLENSEFYHHLLENQVFKHLNFSSFKLLYKASINEFQCSKFHEMCDNQGPTIIVIKTEYDKIFGVYTSLKWNSDVGKWETDLEKSTFIFSISNSTKHKLINADRAIYNYRLLGPYFGSGHDIYVSDKCNLGKLIRLE